MGPSHSRVSCEAPQCPMSRKPYGVAEFCATWRCTLNRGLAGCAPWISFRLFVKGQRGCCDTTVALRLDRHRYRVHAAVRTQAPCVPGPRSRGAIVFAVAQRGCLRLLGGGGLKTRSALTLLQAVHDRASGEFFVGSVCLCRRGTVRECQIAVAPQSQTQPTLVPTSV